MKKINLAALSATGIRCVVVAMCLLSSLLGGSAYSQVYQWVDENGMTHFSDIPPVTDNVVNEVELQINSYESPFIENNNGYAGGNKVIMYSTSWCTYCKKARNYFAANNIDYEEFDIEKSSSARREYDRIGGRGVPVILVGDRKLNGFSVESFKKVYR